MDKIKEAQKILKDLELPNAQQNQISALTFLAICNIKPQDDWKDAERNSMIVSDLMEFVNEHYNIEYKSGTRESFRKDALNPFVSFGIIEKNPDNPNLAPTSPNTHYAVSLIVLNIIKKFNTPDWELALENFSKYKKSITIEEPSFLIKTLKISSYKSIVDDTIQLGRFNVFIGANGCGKTNILEALATVGAERGNDLSFDGLYSRGIRIARPDLTFSSFLNSSQKSSIDISLDILINNIEETYKCSLSPTDINDIYTKWINLAEEELYPDMLLSYFQNISNQYPDISGIELLNKANELIANKGLNSLKEYDNLLSEYAIFDLNTKSLRGISSADSKKTPLGLNGEGLDLLIANLSISERNQLNKCLSFFDWLGEIVADKDDKFKILGLKPGRSVSTLYFKDKFMNKNNNTLSAENSNEGVLHVLFYLALFISNKTPKLFAIDNIETALNPRLCQVLISELVKLSKESGKQTLVTTHNPAILDGLNLFDDDQRLFEVSRDSFGRTRTRRIQFKKDLSDKTFKLSEMWLKGLLGAVPKNF